MCRALQEQDVIRIAPSAKIMYSVENTSGAPTYETFCPLEEASGASIAGGASDASISGNTWKKMCEQIAARHLD